MKTLAVVLLAGGQSRRMGRDKALLSIDGKPLWQWQWEKLRALRPAALYLSARESPAWQPKDAELILDRSAEVSRGPLDGLAATLAQVSATHVLALGIDLPEISFDYLQRLYLSAKPGLGLVPQRENFYEPLAAIYPREAAPLAEACLAGEDRSLQNLIRRLRQQNLMQPVSVAPHEEKLFTNLNSPEDYVSS